MTLVLAGDIGGTKSLLALASRDSSGTIHLEHFRECRSNEQAGVGEMLRQYLDSVKLRPSFACIGLAGPVIRQTWSAPNLPWRVDAAGLSSQLGMPVLLLNDLQAAAYGVAELGPSDLRVLQPGHPEPQGPRALISAGTGLGQAFLTWVHDGYEAHATEGGHGDFAARTEQEWRLRRFLASRHPNVSYERVVSGPGLTSIYEFLLYDREERVPPALRAAMFPDSSAAISRFALAGQDRLAARALEIFVSVYGAEAGNLAMRTAATGGIYVGGGIAPKILDALVDGTFLASFRDKGRFANYLDRIPVSIILNTKAALLGAASQGLRMSAASTPALTPSGGGVRQP